MPSNNNSASNASTNVDMNRICLKPPNVNCIHSILGWFKNPLSSQTEKLMAGTKFSDYIGLNHYKKAKK